MAQDTIPAAVVDRLAKIAGLLGSDHDGERAAAAYQASKILFEHRLTWRELIVAAGPREPREAPSWRTQLQQCHDAREALSPWERGFVDSLRSWRGPLTERQRVVLSRLYERVG